MIDNAQVTKCVGEKTVNLKKKIKIKGLKCKKKGSKMRVSRPRLEVREMDVQVDSKMPAIENFTCGVFTLDDIKKGDYICYYDGVDEIEENKYGTDVHYIPNPQDMKKIRRGCITTALTVPTISKPNEKDTNGKDKEVEDKKNEKKIINHYKEGNVGHFVRDWCILNFNETVKEFHEYRSVRKKIALYDALSLSKCNVCFHKGQRKLWHLYARRDIKAGEELYRHYGSDYWLRRLIKRSIYPAYRLLYMTFITGTDQLLYSCVKDDEASTVFITTIIGIDINDPIWAKMKCIEASPSKKLITFLDRVTVGAFSYSRNKNFSS